MNTEYIISAYAALDPHALKLLGALDSEASYEAALEALESVQERMGQDPAHPLRPLFELLAERVEAYETRYALPDAPPHERLGYLMESRGLTQQGLAAATGIAQSNLSAVLGGTRGISKGMAHKLAAYFGLPLEVFL